MSKSTRLKKKYTTRVLPVVTYIIYVSNRKIILFEIFLIQNILSANWNQAHGATACAIVPLFIYVLSIIFGQKQEECVLTPELISGAKSWCFHKQIHIYCLEGAPQKGPRQQLSRHLPGADAARCICQNNQKKIRSKNGNDANKITKIKQINMQNIYNMQP